MIRLPCSCDTCGLPMDALRGTRSNALGGSTTDRRVENLSMASGNCFCDWCRVTGYRDPQGRLSRWLADSPSREVTSRDVSYATSTSTARSSLRHVKCSQSWTGTSNENVDTVPREVWDLVRQDLSDQGMPHRAFAAAMQTKFCGSTMWKHSPSRGPLHRAAAILDDQARSRPNEQRRVLVQGRRDHRRGCARGLQRRRRRYG